MLGRSCGPTDDTAEPHPCVLCFSSWMKLPGQKQDHFLPGMTFMTPRIRPSINSTDPATNTGKMLKNRYKHPFEKHIITHISYLTQLRSGEAEVRHLR